MLVLIDEGSEKAGGDDKELFAAALRCRHDKQHYRRMLTVLQRYFATLDHPGMLIKILHELTAHAEEDEPELNPATFQKIESYLQAKEVGFDDLWLAEYPFLAQFCHGRSPLQLRLVDLFRLFDRNVDGCLSRTEVVEGFQRHRIDIGEEQAQLLFSLIDLDDDGTLNYQEMALYRLEVAMDKRRRAGSATADAPEEKTKDETPAQPEEPAVQETKGLQLTIEEFADILLYAHYITRP
ncbi:uncharacterized protein MONBRDRAFT_5632 [Monosiga brevicollis MX1]|uniref:EF-hand domain-containing protein n=1 Tax=Monosiga brevicollis TaxID=81824 RepID=A9US04_MONBE|nr:uncharacterized protein MONBRDRAFT_5632 [Monosiga brevicollis MX1]EDQ91695.1 predicted protein [Monosiga brevicollis MX1]|eukprot:XP_001742981.1 hypothetical protein [Monosiga brevicollis MX1]